jgi:hypothetical protein
LKCSSTSSATTSTAAPAAPWPCCIPLKLVIDNYPEGQEEFVEVANNPEDPSAGTRQVPFSGEIYIEQDDFREVPPPKYYRLSPGKEVRLRNAYFITAQSVVKDEAGNIVEVHCTYDPASRGGNSPDGRKVKSTMHWVSAAHAISAEIRLYDKLFTKPDPNDVEEGEDVLDNLNPNSLEILTGAKLEPSLANAKLEDRFQFERVGYFCLDPDSTPGMLVFNRTLPLKDSWAKIEKKAQVSFQSAEAIDRNFSIFFSAKPFLETLDDFELVCAIPSAQHRGPAQLKLSPGWQSDLARVFSLRHEFAHDANSKTQIEANEMRRIETTVLVLCQITTHLSGIKLKVIRSDGYYPAILLISDLISEDWEVAEDVTISET